MQSLRELTSSNGRRPLALSRSSSARSPPPRSLSPQLSISNISRLESENAELKFRLSDYKLRVEGLQRNLQVSMKSVDEAQQSCMEAAERLNKLEAERDQLVEHLESARQQLNNQEQYHDHTKPSIYGVQVRAPYYGVKGAAVRSVHLEAIQFWADD